MFSRDTQALMQATVDAVLVVDHRGQIQAVNDATSRMFGFSPEEMQGRNVSMLMPEPDASAHDAHMARYLETGVAKIIGIGREVRARRKDGSTFPARLSVGRIADDSPPRFVGLLRDVSAEHQAMAALKLERDRAQAFLELHDAILVEIDASLRVREINAHGADQLGAPVEEFRERPWLGFFQGETERERARAMLAGAASGNGSRESEFDALDFLGNRRRIHWRCIALRNSAGTATGWLCSGSDVTDRAQREESAHLAQDRLTRVARLATMGEMAAGIAHEINQPLTAITSYARACERYLSMARPDFDELREAVREISAEGLRAGDTIQKLRRLVRADMPEKHQPIDVNALIDELRTLLVADARVHGAELRFALAPALPSVLAHGAQIQQVVLNLARNAFEALLDTAPGARHVELSTACAGHCDVEIRVTDDGPGIAPQIAERLFDPFATTKGTGTGLGLAISRTIVLAHGGTIGVRAAEPRGSTFCVRLPIQEGLT